MKSRRNRIDRSGKRRYSPSALGWCPRALAAYTNGYCPTTSVWLEEAAEAGILAEDQEVDRLIDSGVDVSRCQEVVEVDITKSAVISGKIDGVITDGDRQLVLEIKSMSANRFDEWLKHGFKAFPKYAIQISCYMHILKMPAQYIIVCRDDDRRVSFEITKLPVSFEEIKKKVLHVEQFVGLKELPICDDTKKNMCRFDFLHEYAAPIQWPELDDLCREYRSARGKDKGFARSKIYNLVNGRSTSTYNFNISVAKDGRMVVRAVGMEKMMGRLK